MKNLFAAVLMCAPFLACAAEPERSAGPEAAVERKPTPGFWERAWGSTKKGAKSIVNGTKRVGSAVASPFGGRKKSGETTPWGALSMSMVLEPALVKLPETRSVKVLVTVSNTGKFPAQLEFPTTQRIEVLVKNDSGKVLSKWSDDQRVDKEQGFLVINPEERLEYSATISTRSMAAGQAYVIEAYFPSFEQLRSSRTVSPVK